MKPRMYPISRQTSNLSRLLVGSLLVIYFTGTSGFELLHSFVHHHEEQTVTHSAEQESNPCHRLVFHNDVEQGCGHDSHLIVSDKCQLCDHVISKDQVYVDPLVFSRPEFKPGIFLSFKQDLDSYRAAISSSRAPPALN